MKIKTKNPNRSFSIQIIIAVLIAVSGLFFAVVQATTLGTSVAIDGNLNIGNESPTVALDGEDAYVEGTFEVDGASRFDGTAAMNANLTLGSSSALLYSTNAIGSTTNGATWYDGTNFLGYTGNAQVRLNNSRFLTTGVITGNIAGASGVFGALNSNGFVDIASANNANRYMIFFPGSPKTIQSAKIYLALRSGSYSGTVTATLKIYNLAGTQQHATSTSVDLETATADSWLTLTLSDTAADKAIDAGEVAVLHLALDGATGGNFVVYVVPEIEVK